MSAKLRSYMIRFERRSEQEPWRARVQDVSNGEVHRFDTTGEALSHLVRHLAADGAEVTIVALDDAGASPGETPPQRKKALEGA